jgi:hypothetical protein
LVGLILTICVVLTIVRAMTDAAESILPDPVQPQM